MSAQEKPQVLFHREEIQAAVKKLATEISRDYRDKHPILISILIGSFIFMSDLIRQLDFPLEVEFVRLSSYGSGTRTSEKIKLELPLRCPIKGREVLVIEDIVDSGLSTSFFLNYLREKKPASLKLCALLDKPSRRRVPVAIDYLGLTVPDKFIVGYGLDYDEKFRNLPDICSLEAE